jgi:hypothetical protein
MSSQNARGSSLRLVVSDSLGGVEGRLSLVRVAPVISECCLPRWNRNQLRETIAW